MIPKIEIARNLAEKQYSGILAFEFEAEKDLVEIPYTEVSSPVKAELSFEILEDDSVKVAGTIEYTLKGLCSRCLKETEQKIVFETEGYFVPQGKKGEDGDYSYDGKAIDLSEFMRDTLAFSMPMALHCSENCKALAYGKDQEKR